AVSLSQVPTPRLTYAAASRSPGIRVRFQPRIHSPTGTNERTGPGRRLPPARKTRDRQRRLSARSAESDLFPGESYPASPASTMFPLFFLWLHLTELVSFVRRHIGDRSSLAQLQRANVGDDPPPVIGWYLGRIIRHSAKSFGRHIKEVAYRRIAQSLFVKRGRLAEATLHNHSRSVSKHSVA